MRQQLTQERLRELLDYNEDTGKFTWQVATNNRVKVGDATGTSTTRGYARIMVDGTSYQAHRLAWLYVQGRWPSAQIDHINGDRADNRIANLRECNNSENQQNQKLRGDSTSGHTGVSFRRDRGKFRAYIQVGGNRRNLGTFPTPELAHAAYLAAKVRFHTFNPVPRKGLR